MNNPDLTNYDYDPNMDFEARVRAAREASLMKLNSQDYEGRAWDQGQGIHNLGQTAQPTETGKTPDDSPLLFNWEGMDPRMKPGYGAGFETGSYAGDNRQGTIPPAQKYAPFNPTRIAQLHQRALTQREATVPGVGAQEEFPYRVEAVVPDVAGRYPEMTTPDMAALGRAAGIDPQTSSAGGHVRATINGKEYDYTTAATNPNAYAGMGSRERAPQLTGDSHTFQEYVGQGKYGEEMYQPHTVQTNARDNKMVDAKGPAASFMQGTPEQQRALQFERLQEENAIAEQEYRQRYLQLSPGDRAQMIAQEKAAADPRFAMVQQLSSILEQVVIPQVREAEAAFRQANPNATPQEISDMRRKAAQDIMKAATEMSASIFGRMSPYGFEFSDYTPANQQQQPQ